MFRSPRLGVEGLGFGLRVGGRVWGLDFRVSLAL